MANAMLAVLLAILKGFSERRLPLRTLERLWEAPKTGVSTHSVEFGVIIYGYVTHLENRFVKSSRTVLFSG
jgi:hypothetical protein